MKNDAIRTTTTTPPTMATEAPVSTIPPATPILPATDGLIPVVGTLDGVTDPTPPPGWRSDGYTAQTAHVFQRVLGGEGELTIRVCLPGPHAIDLIDLADARFAAFAQRIHRLTAACPEYRAWEQAHARLATLEGRLSALRQQAATAQTELDGMVSGSRDITSDELNCLIGEIGSGKQQIATLQAAIDTAAVVVRDKAFTLSQAARQIGRREMMAEWDSVLASESDFCGLLTQAREALDELLVIGHYRSQIFNPAVTEDAAAKATVALTGSPIPPPPKTPQAAPQAVNPMVAHLAIDGPPRGFAGRAPIPVGQEVPR